MIESNCGARKPNTACSFKADRKDFGNNGNFSSDTTEHKIRPLVNRNKYIYTDHDKYLAEINQNLPSDLH